MDEVKVTGSATEELRAVIVAAGSSNRMGFDKLRAPLFGKTVLWHAVHAFAQVEALTGLVVVAHPERVEQTEESLEGALGSKRMRVIAGGAQRHLSVWEGLRALEEEGGKGGWVAVHDGARPLITEDAIRGCWSLAQREGAACCATPIPDTVKRVDGQRVVVESVDREGLWGMQTPQVFAFEAIWRAYEILLARGICVTDEVSAIQTIGGRVALHWNEGWNFKITFPRDLEMAEDVLRVRSGQPEKWV